MYEKIDLSNSALSRKEKAKLMKMLIKYRDAFSLRDEIGECPNLEADIKVIDESPFFVRPFPISKSDKPFMDSQMKRLVSLGILSKNSVRSNLAIHRLDTPFIIRQPIHRPHLLERVYKPIRTPHWCGDLQSLLLRTLEMGCKQGEKKVLAHML